MHAHSLCDVVAPKEVEEKKVYTRICVQKKLKLDKIGIKLYTDANFTLSYMQMCNTI